MLDASAMSVRRFAASALLLFALAACAQVIGLSNLEEGSGPADAGGAPRVDSGIPDTCFNGTKDTGESDVDCGGSCRKCMPGKICDSNDDCHVSCTANKCVGCSDAGVVPIPGGGGRCIDLTEVSVKDYEDFLAQV